MAKVIMIHTDWHLIIGQVYQGIRALNGEWLEDQRYRVVARSSASQYVEYVVSMGFDRASIERMVKVAGRSRCYYEIQTD